MNWYKVGSFALSMDLSPLLTQLKNQGVVYRVTEEPKGQCLWLSNELQAGQLKQFIHEHGLDSLQQATMGEAAVKTTASLQDGEQFLWRKMFELRRAMGHYPVTLLCILLGILGAICVHYDHQLTLVSLLTFQPIYIVGEHVGLGTVTEGLSQGQYWRLFTPVFLHFGLFHILFNGLWIWEFGRRIELGLGSAILSGLIISIGLASNLTQYWWGGASLFGGLSGVLYGLMGFLWIYNKFRPHPVFALQPGIIGFMIGWMVLGMTGAVDFFMDGSIANAAHFGGLMAGILLALLATKLISKTPGLSAR